MSTNTKRAAVVVTVFLTFAVYRVVADLLASGGLGAMSADEMIRGFVVPSALVGILFYWYWRHRRQAKKQNPAPRP
jgi:ABC-type Co2+ transport system permease subunit